MAPDRNPNRDSTAGEGATFPGKTYAEHVLKHVFNDQRDHLFAAMFAVHRAHVLMLGTRGLISRAHTTKLLQAIEEVATSPQAAWQYDPQYEDLFFMVEAKITEKVGPEVAGNMHIGRSCNDLGVAMYRLVLREKLLHVIDSVLQLREALLQTAHEHIHTVMPAYTHTQPAQPTTFGHYTLAMFDVLTRDTERLKHAFLTVNQSPLGAAALTTTGFPISREQVKALLGFDGLVENSYDAIGGADYLLETATSLATLMANIGRWVQDLLLFCTREFAAVRVADPYVQISSIMPQKRNPVSLEHSRALASSAIADAQGVVTMVHNTPFGDIVDTEDDLQPHLYRAMHKAVRVLSLLNVVVRTLHVDKALLAERAKEGFITMTELADTLVRNYSIPFRSAHHITSDVAKEACARGLEMYELTPVHLTPIFEKFGYGDVAMTSTELSRLSDPAYFVHVRNRPGGPNAKEMKRMLTQRKQTWEKDAAFWKQKKIELAEAATTLQQRVRSLIRSR